MCSSCRAALNILYILLSTKEYISLLQSTFSSQGLCFLFGIWWKKLLWMRQTVAQNPESMGGLAQSQVFISHGKRRQAHSGNSDLFQQPFSSSRQSRENPKHTAGSPKDAQETLFSGTCAEASVTSAFRKTPCL